MSAFDRRLTPARPDLAALHLRGTVEAPRYAEGKLMHVVAEVTDMRPEPSLTAAIDTQALFGQDVMVYDVQQSWAWVQLLSDHYVGYVAIEALSEGACAATHRLRVNRSFIYPGPNMKLPVSGALPLNAGLRIVAKEGDFLQLAQGGYVFAAHAAPLTAHETDFVAVAERLLGVPYLWGGKSALGIDCSGLVQLALACAGFEAPRDTDLQEKHLGSAIPFDVSLSNPRRGDVVFWKGHVGVMRDAHELLHANAHHMLAASEPLADAVARIQAKTGAMITSIKRML